MNNLTPLQATFRINPKLIQSLLRIDQRTIRLTESIAKQKIDSICKHESQKGLIKNNCIPT